MNEQVPNPEAGRSAWPGYGRRAWRAIVLGAVLIAGPQGTSGAAPPITIDFETLPGSSPSDNLLISDQYEADFGVSFYLDINDNGLPDEPPDDTYPAMEAVGEADPESAFVNNSEPPFDDDDPLNSFAHELGEFFLRGLPIHTSQDVPALIVVYSQPVAEASGHIWDIDGDVVNGAEQWRVEAMGADYLGAAPDPTDVLETIDSPPGYPPMAGHGDARPWFFSFTHAAPDIHALRLTYIGTKLNVGLAFDRFSPASASPPSIPALDAWGALTLSGLLVAAGLLIGGARRLAAASGVRPTR